MSSKVPWPNLRLLFPENFGHPQLPPVPPLAASPSPPPGPPSPSFEVSNATTNSRTTPSPDILSRASSPQDQPMAPLRRLPPPLSPEVVGTDSPRISDYSNDSDTSVFESFGGSSSAQSEDLDQGAVQFAMSPDSSESSESLPFSPTPDEDQLTLYQPMDEQVQSAPDWTNEEVRLEVTRIQSLPPNQRKFECLHEGCDKVYSSRFHLKYHISLKHASIPPIPCHICTLSGILFNATTLPEFYTHLYAVHEQSMFICHLCYLNLSTTKKVAAHFRLVHDICAPKRLPKARKDSEELPDGQMWVVYDSEESSDGQNPGKRAKMDGNGPKNLPGVESEAEAKSEIHEEPDEVTPRLIKKVIDWIDDVESDDFGFHQLETCNDSGLILEFDQMNPELHTIIIV